MEPRSNRARRALVAAAAVLAAAPAAVAVTTPANASVPSTPPGWTLQWSDDFTGAAGSLPSSSNWIFDLGHNYPGGPANWGTGEIQNYTNSPNNIKLDGAGNLRITALRDGAGNWTSARIETQRSNFKPPAGGKLAIEGRIQMPNVTGDAALGYWPAFWALGSPYRGNYWNWPAIGEFDIMENVNGLNSVWGVLHCGVNPGGPCDETNGRGASRACPGSSCQSAFHTYRFEWDDGAKELRWYVDGQQFHTVSQSQLGAETWNNMTNHAGYFILLNLAMGGAFPNGVAGFNTPTAATVPGHSLVVDYVAVWSSGNGGGENPGGSGWDAYGEIQAEQATSRSGGTVEGGQAVAQLGNGNSLKFSGVRFGSRTATQFNARVASGAASGVSGLVEVRLDSPTATPVGSFAIANTGGWQSWRTVPANIAGVTGTHDVYITFTSGQPAPFTSVDWIKFG
ncbi:carbohydrate-binding protein [Saccharothrix coeruleofusca]|uniref:Endo-1,3-beta-glucanase n=1 Tax=Saccharothrix coeruleofusca TaxID=33919 RepID=A0A918EBU5_9PSEU|nr:carbohydrate-binding protein [Saccharothrix coeruleofusca]MBP2334079.1 beta-glucanase (GH16 family) [Saccharothrix coeruleofusca]GGP43568.1 endo-1,3-beta-glucanase [Saccharothrix coeruleofusca]